jgi:hypothetical protein
MNHAPSAVTPLDPELIEVGDAIGQRAQRRGLVQGAMPVPGSVVMPQVLVGFQNLATGPDLR